VTDAELIKGCINEDRRCQQMLFERYAGKMTSVCLRYARDLMEAEDMLQDAFMRVYDHLHQFKFEGSFEGWVRRIVVNTALRYCQKRKIHFEEIKTDHYQNEPNLEPFVYTQMSENDIMQVISQLPPGYKMVFNLHVIEGYSHEDIAKMLKIQASTSRSQLLKARKLLQQNIQSLHKTVVHDRQII
jgi:RNA polymerase sigma factor (sigma-70 family)